MPFSKPLAKYNSTVLFVLIFNNLLSAAIWSNLWHAHVSGFVEDSSVSQSYHFSDGRDCIGILQEFSAGKNRWKQNYTRGVSEGEQGGQLPRTFWQFKWQYR